MSDLIRRQDALDALKQQAEEMSRWSERYAEQKKGVLTAINVVSDVPSAQPERTGKWQITDAYPHNVYCSECHTRFAQTHWAVWENGSLPRNFCPNCGAMMKEGEEE